MTIDLNRFNAIVFILLSCHVKKAQIAVGSSQKKLHYSPKCESRKNDTQIKNKFLVVHDYKILHH